MASKVPPDGAAPVVLITGCSTGIGLLTAMRFARAGYRVFASMRDPARGKALVERAEQEGWWLRTPALDVTRDDSVAAAVATMLEETGGRIDVLVNNAGYLVIGPVEETTPEELRAQLDTNVVGVLRTLRAVLPTMRAQRRGSVVNISSVLGRVVVPANGIYQASKWALEALTETLRYELRPFGIRVTCVEPGPFKTEIRENQVRTGLAMAEGSPYWWMVDSYLQSSGRLHRGKPEKVADTIFRAATAAHPRLRWSVGATAMVSSNARRLIPDRLYELGVRWMLRRSKTP
jgi:NAD(P)-dependent dehydrogenase (short-subunit alcohol dehydrogenase family)